MKEIVFRRPRATYFTAALVAIGLLAGCGDPEIFDRVATTGDASTADWPRLADTQTPPPAGVYDEAAPDPASGAAVREDLAASAAAADARRRAIAGPVE